MLKLFIHLCLTRKKLIISQSITKRKNHTYRKTLDLNTINRVIKKFLISKY